MSNLPEILMTNPMHPGSHEDALGSCVVHRLWLASDRDALLTEVGGRVRGLIATKDPIDRALLERLPKLEIIANFGVGYDRVDVATATERGIVVTNTPGVLDDEVADLTIGLLLAVIRRIPQADQYLRANLWPQAAFPLSPTLRGRRIGIVGMGNIGRTIAKRLGGFDVAIGYHSRTSRPGMPYAYHPTVLGLAEASDVLIVIIPGDAGTANLIDAAVLEQLGPRGVLVNVARGSVVDEAALIAALQAGTIQAAGLDVFAREPHVPEALLKLDNVVLLPHIGSASHHTRTAMSDLVIENIRSWFDGCGAVSPIDAR